MQIADERSSRKRPLTDPEVEALLVSVETVRIARGRAIRTVEAAAARPDDLKGPTGNYRAPMVRRGPTLLVGFHAESLGELLRG